MHRSLATLVITAALALAISGCGSGSSNTTASQSTEAATPTAATPTSASTTAATTQGAAQTSQGSPREAQGSSKTPGNSVMTYGSAASSAQKAALAAAAHSFFAAMAVSDYAKICTGLLNSNREQLESFLEAKHQRGDCPTLLKTLIPASETTVARKAATGAVTAVRVKGDTAFVIFRPKGGQPSYLVLRRKFGAWRALSFALGTPHNPLAGLGK
jgi:hypothetical protein